MAFLLQLPKRGKWGTTFQQHSFGWLKCQFPPLSAWSSVSPSFLSCSPRFLSPSIAPWPIHSFLSPSIFIHAPTFSWLKLRLSFLSILHHKELKAGTDQYTISCILRANDSSSAQKANFSHHAAYVLQLLALLCLSLNKVWVSVGPALRKMQLHLQ